MTRAKRPPRSVWIAVNARGLPVGVYATKTAGEAAKAFNFTDVTITGPYILAERVRQK